MAAAAAAVAYPSKGTLAIVGVVAPLVGALLPRASKAEGLDDLLETLTPLASLGPRLHGHIVVHGRVSQRRMQARPALEVVLMRNDVALRQARVDDRARVPANTAASARIEPCGGCGV
jgi:hypothetical protein